jgi:hypothetical protein
MLNIAKAQYFHEQTYYISIMLQAQAPIAPLCRPCRAAPFAFRKAIGRRFLAAGAMQMARRSRSRGDLKPQVSGGGRDADGSAACAPDYCSIKPLPFLG